MGVFKVGVKGNKAMNKQTKEQEARFDEAFPPKSTEDGSGELSYTYQTIISDPNDFKQFLAGEIALSFLEGEKCQIRKQLEKLKETK